MASASTRPPAVPTAGLTLCRVPTVCSGVMAVSDAETVAQDAVVDEEWLEFLRENEAAIRREANSDAPDAHLFQRYVRQLEVSQS